MIHNVIKYEDYDGNQRTEDAYFNINDVELARLEATYPGGFSKALEKAQKTNDAGDYFRIFEEIVKTSYGIKSEDGRRLIKNPTATEEFMQSEAYSELFYLVLKDEEAADKFFKGVLGTKHFMPKESAE